MNKFKLLFISLLLLNTHSDVEAETLFNLRTAIVVDYHSDKVL